MTKFTDKQFFACLRDCAGIYARTARKLKELYDIEITRQGVKDRADRHLDIVSDIREESVDVAEDSIYGMMLQNKDLRIKLEATKSYLKAMGKHRGWNDKFDVIINNTLIITPEERNKRIEILQKKLEK